MAGNKNSGRRSVFQEGETTPWRRPGGHLPPAAEVVHLADNLDREIYTEIRDAILALPTGGNSDLSTVLKLVAAERWFRRCEADIRRLKFNQIYTDGPAGKTNVHSVVGERARAMDQCVDLLHRLMLTPRSRVSAPIPLEAQRDGSIGAPQKQAPGAPSQAALLRLIPKAGG